MTWQVIWEQPPLRTASGFLDEPDGLRLLFDAVDLLADDPRPVGTTEWGPGRRRAHIGRYRVMYEVNEAAETVTVTHIGRIS